MSPMQIFITGSNNLLSFVHMSLFSKTETYAHALSGIS